MRSLNNNYYIDREAIISSIRSEICIQMSWHCGAVGRLLGAIKRFDCQLWLRLNWNAVSVWIEPTNWTAFQLVDSAKGAISWYRCSIALQSSINQKTNRSNRCRHKSCRFRWRCNRSRFDLKVNDGSQLENAKMTVLTFGNTRRDKSNSNRFTNSLDID